jgi:hypothetical protein
MEKKLIEWTIVYIRVNGSLPSHHQTKQKAMEFSKSNLVFKASKGWYEKFMHRHFGDLKSQSKYKITCDKGELRVSLPFQRQTLEQAESIYKQDEGSPKNSKGSVKGFVAEFEKSQDANRTEYQEYPDISGLIAKKSPQEGADVGKEVDSQKFSICKMDPQRNYEESRSPKRRM